MGLLDFMGSSVDDPKTAATLALAQGLLGGRSGMTGLLGGMQGYVGTMAQAKREEEARKAEALKMQIQQQQLIAAQQQNAQAAEMAKRQQALQQLAQSSMKVPQGLPSMLPGSGQRSPQENAALQQGIQQASKPQFDFQGYAEGLAGLDPMASLQMRAALQKDETPIKLGAGETLLDKKTFKPLASNPKDDKPAPLKEYEYAVQQGYKGTYQQFVLEQKRAGATNVSVSMDKGFGEAFAKDAAASLATGRDQARAAASNIQTLDRIGQIMDGGKVSLGPTQKFETFGRQLGETLGIGGKDNAEKLGNTRNLIQSAATLAADGAKLLAGQGQITEGERALILRASGGDIDSMTAPEIRALTGTLRKVNAVKIQAHQQQLKNVDPKFAPYVPFYKVDEPVAGGWSITPVGR